jgi:hypothetical protein
MLAECRYSNLHFSSIMTSPASATRSAVSTRVCYIEAIQGALAIPCASSLPDALWTLIALVSAE